MTDKQLHVLLDTLRQELAKTVEETQSLLDVHGLGRSQKLVARDKDGRVVYGFAVIGATNVNYEDDPGGRFIALDPLDALVRDWKLRFLDLLPEKAEGNSVLA